MKKSFIALALAASIAPAWATEVVSSNIVGYQTMSLDAGYNMIGIQFVQVGGDAKDLSTVAELDDTMAGFDEDGIYATQMMVWRNGNYLPTFGWSGSSGSDYLDDSSLDNKWLNLDYEETADELAAADAVWIKAGSAGTVKVYGQVPTNDTITIQLAPGYNMVANPFPKTVKIADFGTLSSNMAGFDEDGIYATQMMVWKDGNYLPTFGWSGTSGTDYLDDSSLDNKWLNLDYEETDDTVDFGHGVWIKAGSAGTITFSAQ